MKYYFIMNPGAKGGKSARKIDKLLKMLNSMDLQYAYCITQCLEDAYTLSVKANKAGYDCIVAVGGDGTLNRVLNGFYDKEGNRISSASMGVIYTGTSPDFCKSYGIPIHIKEAVSVLIKNHIKKIMIGKITFANAPNTYTTNTEDEKNVFSSGAYEVKYFGCCANIGLGAALARQANSGIRKRLGDTLGTFVSLLRILTTFKAGNYVLRKDGESFPISNVHNISIGRTYDIASGIKVANHLKVIGHEFYLLYVKNLHLCNLFNTLRKLYGGKPFVNDEVMGLDYAKNIEIFSCNPYAEVEFDGDPMGYLPCKIEPASGLLDLVSE